VEERKDDLEFVGHKNSVVYWHRFYADSDPDPTFHFDADVSPDAYPRFIVYMDHYPCFILVGNQNFLNSKSRKYQFTLFYLSFLRLRCQNFYNFGHYI